MTGFLKIASAAAIMKKPKTIAVKGQVQIPRLQKKFPANEDNVFTERASRSPHTEPNNKIVIKIFPVP
jgi:hypothetical protein